MSPSPDRHHEAFEADADDVRAFEALQERHFLNGEWDALAALYRRREQAPSLADDPHARAALCFRRGQVLEERCLDPDAAQQAYWEAVRHDHAHRAAVRQLRRIHAARGEWDQVLQIAEIEDAAPMKPFERAAFLAEMGRVWLDRLDEPDHARLHFERALDQVPDHVDALDGLARAQEALERFEDAAATWERLAEQQRGPDRAVALAALAALCEGPLRQPERAVELYRRTLTEDPRHPRAVEALVADARQREQWTLLADLLERRLAVAQDDATRVTTALEASRLELEHLGNPHAARMWLLRARELAPDDAEIHFALAELESRVGNADAQLEALDRALALAGSAAPVSSLLEAGTLHAERGRHDRALPVLRAALELAPEHPLVCETLSETLAQLGRHDELAELLERRAALAADDPEQQAEAFAELGRLQERDLDDPTAAVHALGRAFALRPALDGVAAGLERLHRKAEDWTALRDLLEQARRDGPSAERLGYHCSLGEVLLEHFEDVDGAARAFEAALELDASDGRALQGLARVAAASGDPEALLHAREREAAITRDGPRFDALAAEIVRELEALGRGEEALAWAERWADSGTGQREALEAAARLQEALDRDEALAATLERLDAVLEPEEQAPGRRRLAAVHMARGDTANAVRWLEAALEREPRHLDTLRALASQLERGEGDGRERVEALARTYRRLAEVAPGPERSATLGRLVDLLAERAGDLDGAIVVAWRWIEDPEAPPEASRRLETMLERAGRYEELAQLWLQQRRRLDGEAAWRLDLRLGHMLLERLARFDDAAEAFRRVRSAARGDARDDATRGLEQALRGANDFDGLVVLLAERAAGERDPARRASVELERAALLEDAIGEFAEARETYERLWACDASPAVAREAGARLERLLERSGDWRGLRALLERTLLAPGLDAAAELALRERVAALCRDRLADPEGCVEHLEAAGRLAPERDAVWRSLALLHEQAERWDDVVRVLEAELAARPDSAREQMLRRRAGELCAGRLGDPERARPHYLRLLELEPGDAHAARFCLERAEHAGDWEEVARLLDLRLEAVRGERDPAHASERTALRLRLAAVRAEQLDDPHGALSALEPALDETGVHPAVAEPLADLYARTGRDDALVKLCGRAADRADDPHERAGWSLRRAEALRARGDLREAVEGFRRTLVDRPEDPAARTALGELYRELGEHAALAQLLEDELPRRGPEPELRIRVELAALLAGPLDRPDEALAHLQRALDLDPAHAEAGTRALAVAERLGRHEVMDELLAGRLALPLAPDERAGLLERRAALLGGELGRGEEAVAAWREAVALAPGRREARQGLRAALEALGRWPGVLDCLYLEAQAAEPEERVRILEQAAHVAQVHLGRDAVLPWLERLRAERPSDGSVLERIADVHRQAGRPEALLRALDEEIALASNPDRRRALHVERARVLERDLGAPGRAAAALEAAREAAPDDPEVLAALDRLYAGLGRARERVDVVEARLALPSDEDRAALHREAATLWADALAEPERALPHRLHALALDPDADGERRLEDLRRLEDVLRACARPEAWVRAAEAELGLCLRRGGAELAARARVLRRELAAVHLEALAEPDAARSHLTALLDAEDPDAERREWAETQLLHLLRVAGDPLALAARLEARLRRRAAQSDASEAQIRADAEGWLELARLREEALHEPAAAGRAYAEVLARDPRSLDATRGLRRTAERRGDARETARALELELALLETDPGASALRGALWRRLGPVALEQLGDRDRAARAWRRALDEDPRDRESLRALQSLLESIGDWTGAAQRYEQEIDALGDGESARRAELWLRIGEIARDRLGDRARALEAFERADEGGVLSAPRLREWRDLLDEAGEREREVDISARWCDHPATAATARDHVALAERLEALGRADDARARARRATALEPEERRAWDVLARLCDAADDPAAAAEALERAAALSSGAEAAPRWTAAALRQEPEAPQRAAELLRRAVDCDPASAEAHAHRARLEEALERDADAEDAAGAALDAGLDDAPLRLATARVGGRAARRRGRPEAAARFFGAALETDPADAEALEAQAELLFELGDRAAARPLLERRLAMEPAPRSHARAVAMLGRALEDAGEAEAALDRYEAALALEPDVEEAHAGCVRVHRTAERRDRALAALERWAGRAEAGEARAALWLQAAAITREAALVGGSGVDAGDAERPLREATEADPSSGEAWAGLATLLWETGRRDDALEVCERGLARVEDPTWRAPLAWVRGRALEAAGETAEAAEAYMETVRCDPRARDAALAAARLRRAAGEWQAAAEALDTFALHHPEPRAPELAEVLEQLARLCAGPLEDMERAIAAYERALAVRPDLESAREALAGLLSHRPERSEDAVRQHARLLAEDPTRAASLRALVRLARERTPEACGDGLAVLRALGAATPAERNRAPERLSLPVATAPPFDSPAGQALHAAAHEAGSALVEALGASAEIDVDRALAAADPDTLERVLVALAALALEATLPASGSAGNAPARDALEERLGRWSRRKVRRALLGLEVRDVAALDFEHWRCALRVHRAARALDADGDLRGALETVLREYAGDRWTGDAAAETADLTARVRACPEASGLLAHVVGAWVESL